VYQDDDRVVLEKQRSATFLHLKSEFDLIKCFIEKIDMHSRMTLILNIICLSAWIKTRKSKQRNHACFVLCSPPIGWYMTYSRGPYMKAIHTQGEGRFVQWGHFSDKGVLQMRTSAFFDVKNFGFFEICYVSARTKGVQPVRTFCGQGGGVSFRDFVRTSFMNA